MPARHNDETRAAVMSALLSGQSVSSVAKEYDIPKGTVSRWRTKAEAAVKGSASNGPKKESASDIGDKVGAYLSANLSAITAQTEVFADPDWLRSQEAADLAVLHGVMTDKAVRLIEAFGRAEEE